MCPARTSPQPRLRPLALQPRQQHPESLHVGRGVVGCQRLGRLVGRRCPTDDHARGHGFEFAQCRQRGVDPEFQRQRLTQGLDAGCFEVLAEVVAQPILVKAVGYADRQRSIAHAKLRARTEPNLVTIFADPVGQPGTQCRHDFPIVFGHVLTPAHIPSDSIPNRLNVACSHNLAKKVGQRKLANEDLVVRSISRATRFANASIALALQPLARRAAPGSSRGSRRCNSRRCNSRRCDFMLSDRRLKAANPRSRMNARYRALASGRTQP